MLVAIIDPPNQPAESYVVAIDFTPELGSQTIASRSVTSKRRNDDQDSSSTFLAGSPGGDPGPTCTMRVQGGVAGDIHRVQMRVVTNLGNTYENEIDVPVEDL